MRPHSGIRTQYLGVQAFSDHMHEEIGETIMKLISFSFRASSTYCGVTSRGSNEGRYFPISSVSHHPSA
jgi:hypothetical protein